ncbi:acetyltransferase (GNAT) family protein [Anseongella ginsenosidimutans]|uniref:Acetyltransferase (GNAT) family protein n=1 Tax=Anseongella ginsenosidimutans TaxID=496056 RepID=A0A4R3KNN3_9SPHI|nr:GNAT family N-acetyltransferase [Anseongella ginsenosidimutans]QEC53639.1 GNAT family N-acetyltransferase [Anseongella ginsenosidimutans]TCS86113.1 acetyltransferase (GNAT) family protein [Anseongella ginsenosidimutans]
MADSPACALKLKFITAGQALPLRAAVLRPGQRPEVAVFTGDEEAGSFHAGAFSGERLIAVASFLQNRHADFPEAFQYQLRGMATDPAFRGRGAGAALIRFALQHLEELKVLLLWCNAREKAITFYKKCGFIESGTFFMIPEIGLHQLMYILPKNHSSQTTV